jgi:hypothetical protein
MELFRTIKTYTLQMLGERGVESIIDRLNLEPFYEFYSNFNGGSGLPYHNFYHAQCMILNCYEGAWYSNLPEDDLRGLIVGAMMHDFNHSGGSKSDTVNVQEALSGLVTAQAFARSRLVPLSHSAFEIARNAIKVTEYPFKHVPLTLTERIIRDADMMQPYEMSSYKLIRQYVGLKHEIEVQKNTKYTYSQFAEGVKKFQDSETEWFTEWALEKAKVRNWEMCKHHLSTLLKEI